MMTPHYVQVMLQFMILGEAIVGMRLPVTAGPSDVGAVSNHSAFSLITNLGADYEQYRVPNTPTRLLISYRDEQPIDPLAMQRTLLQTQLRLRRYIQSRWRIEDDVLSRSDDPYLSDPGLHGCFFGIGHYPDGPGEPRRLTYRMVENVMKGAWDRIYRRERYVSAHLLVEDDEVGVVGVAGLTKERPVRSMMSMTSAIDF